MMQSRSCLKGQLALSALADKCGHLLNARECVGCFASAPDLCSRSRCSGDRIQCSWQFRLPICCQWNLQKQSCLFFQRTRYLQYQVAEVPCFQGSGRQPCFKDIEEYAFYFSRCLDI